MKPSALSLSSFLVLSITSGFKDFILCCLPFCLLTLLATSSLLAQNAPVAIAQSITLNEDKGKLITLSGSDADAGTFLSFNMVTPPAHGKLTGNGPTRIYSPEADYNGADSFTFTVTDGAFDSNPATVSLIIDPSTEPTVPGPNFRKFVDPNPGPYNGFGTQIVTLNTGNVVITAPYASVGGLESCGAVYLFNGSTGALISTLTGSSKNDFVGSDGVTALTNGNYVVQSSGWSNNGVLGAGAVTWGNGTTGISGAVSQANSLVGSTANDLLGRFGVTPLTNGHYVVNGRFLDIDGVENAGAATWGNGNTGISGVVSASNSLVGTSTNDYIPDSVTVLANGNYVMSSASWNNGSIENAGAVTWGNGYTGIIGAVTTANSLVGTRVADAVGSRGTTALTNGNYVVTSHAWNNGSLALAGAVTWGNGSTGIIGPVSTSNSLYSSVANVLVGFPGVTALTNGNYVVSSMNWNENAGAVTWGNGRTGTVGAVNTTNSLVGALVWDQVGTGGVTALTNGNYVVSSQEWRTGNMRPGAVTWCNGDTGLVGTVNTSNSLYGSSVGDAGGSTVTALTNGNYVVTNPSWNNGSTANVGAVTWCDGSTGNVGAISATNSLLGTNAEDQVGSSGVIAITNGNYVVCSSKWKNGSLVEAGAVTWADGKLATSSVVSTANSLVGSSAGDQIGSGAAIAMTNGNYAVLSSKWKNGSLINAGAVTWADGNITTNASVSSLNSLIGSHAEDQVGNGGVVALANGHYVVRSLLWDNGLIRDVAALTWSSGIKGISGAVSATNSQIGDLDFTASAVPTQDLLNNHFMTSRVNDEGSKVGLGSQENGFAFAPEIALRGGGRAIVNADTTPRIENDTDFASEMVLNDQTKHVFTIRNTGNAALNLSGTPHVTIAGLHAADFTVTKQPSSVVPLNDLTTFEITFDPSLPGQREATISISSDDSGSSPFAFAIKGFGCPQRPPVTDD